MQSNAQITFGLSRIYGNGLVIRRERRDDVKRRHQAGDTIKQVMEIWK